MSTKASGHINDSVGGGDDRDHALDGTRAAEAACAVEITVDFGGAYDLPRTLFPLQRGYADPSIRVDRPEGAAGSGTVDSGAVDSGALASGAVGSGAWMAFSIDAGPVLVRLDQTSPSEVRVRIWARHEAAAQEAADRAPILLGMHDEWEPFETMLDDGEDQISASLAQVRRRHPGMRLTATGQLFDQLVTATLEQKVTHEQARHGWRTLLRRYGERPPGPAPDWMRLPVPASRLRLVPSWEWHAMWVQPPLAKTIQRLAERESAVRRLGAGTDLGTEAVNALAQRLQAIPGIGPWTVAEALQRSHGAADLPAVGDFHLAHLVGEALTGRRTDDAGMLRLLEPWEGHRQRAIRLIKLSGFSHQRFGPKLHPEDHRGR